MGVAAAAAAWTAFAVAGLALFVALAQVLQQYVSTAQNMRICDSLVWGPMPGQSGRRKWVWHQLRFKVIFEMPNVFIPTEYWWTPGNARAWPKHRITSMAVPIEKPSLRETSAEDGIEQCSEACWVSFTRQINSVCPNLIQIGLLYGDMDRVPSDLCVVPMQVSLRDVIALGLMLGMTINSAGHHHLEMHGPRGSITSSKHQVLGFLIHFSPISMAARFKNLGPKSRNVNKSWFYRLQGIATVAQKPYTEDARSYYQQLGFKWRGYRRNLLTGELGRRDSEQNVATKKETPSDLTFTGIDGRLHVVSASKCSSWDGLQKTLEEENIATPPYVIRLLHPDHHSTTEFPELKHGFNVGPRSWNRVLHITRKDAPNLSFTIVRGDYGPMELASSTGENATDLSALETLLETTVGNDRGTDGWIGNATNEEPGNTQVQHELHPQGPNANAHIPNPENDSSLPATDAPHYSSVKIESHRTPSTDAGSQAPKDPTTNESQTSDRDGGNEKDGNMPTKVSGNTGNKEDVNDGGEVPQPDITKDDVSLRLMEWHTSSSKPEINLKERIPEQEKIHRHPISPSPPPSEPLYRTPRVYPTAYDRSHKPDPPSLTFFWASQIDVEIGPFASPWKHGIYSDAIDALGIMVEMATTALSGLGVEGHSADSASEEVRYVKFPGNVLLNDLWTHLRDGGHTWPAYAMNGRGGITEPPPHQRIQFVAFPGETLPPLLLVQAVAAVKFTGSGLPTDLLMRERIVELASLDYWLSHTASTTAISSAETNVLGHVPSILEEIWTQFWDEITDVVKEKWSSEGNFQDVQRLARSVSRYLETLFPSQATRYFLWVAFLRATKVWQCMSIGANTSNALELFSDDLLIYLA